MKRPFIKSRFFVTLFFGLVSCTVAQETAPSLRYIRSIRIVRQDVFPVIDQEPEFLYRLANRLHVVTRESVVRSDLLFKEGDLVDSDLLEESERRLRRLSYLGEAEIVVQEVAADSVDVQVITHDQWSTLVSTIFDRGGGRTTVGAALEEFNFLGYGKQGFIEGRHEPEGTTWTFRYDDPQLFGSRWTASQLLITGPLVKSYSGEIVRPFYSPDTDWSWGASAATTERIVREFDAGTETNRFERESDGVDVFVSRAFGRRFRKIRLSAGYAFQQRHFAAIPDRTVDLPDDELIHRASVGLQREDLAFVEERQLDKFIRTEDLALGSLTSFSLRRTGIPITRGVKRFEIFASRRDLIRLAARQFVLVSLQFQTLFERDTITSLRLRYYDKSLPQQTLAFNFEFDYDKNPEIDRPFLMGGDTGLRGYPAREFSGNKRVLVNFEDRIFSQLNILTVQLGGVLFFDAGNIWKVAESIDFADMNYSLGFGFRLGYTKSPNSRVGRIDFAWPLNRGGGFGISVGVGQQFSLN